MIGLLWLVYLIWFTDNTWDPDFEHREGFFALGNFLFEDPELPEWLPDPNI